MNGCERSNPCTSAGGPSACRLVQAAADAAHIHDRREASALQGEIRLLQRRLQAMVELSPVGICVLTEDRVRLANRAAGRLVGLESGDALIGLSVYALLRVESHAEVRSRIERVLARPDETSRLSTRVVRRDGAVCDVDIALAALPDPGGSTVQMVLSDVSERHRETVALEHSRRRLQRMSSNAVEAREEEGRRIARELYDELGQRLSALKMELTDLAGPGRPAGHAVGLPSILQHVDEIMSAVRRISADLRPLMLDDLGLNDAIESLVGEFSQRQGIKVELRLAPIEPAIDAKVAIALYRVVQEALNNVARHAQASDVCIDLARHGDELVLSVDDNGIGLPERTSLRDSQFGLLAMEQRAGMLGGRLELDNALTGGARVSVRVPLHAAATPSPRRASQRSRPGR